MNKKGLAVFVAGSILVVACSSSSSSSSSPPPCNEAPFECGSGQTCWTSDAKSFSCLPSGPGQYGDSCQPLAGTTAPCAEGLTCLATTNAGGKCIHYCDSAHACASGTCTAAAFGGASGPITHVCAGGAPATPADAGSD